jgi:hypothetical protein
MPAPRVRQVAIAAAVAVFTAAAGIALLLRASRPPAREPFRFPAAAVTTPTAEIEDAERARLQDLLNELRKTPGAPSAHR